MLLNEHLEENEPEGGKAEKRARADDATSRRAGVPRYIESRCATDRAAT